MLYSAQLLLMLASVPYSTAFLTNWASSGGASSASFIQCPAIPPDMTFCSPSLSLRHSAGLRESVQADNVWIALLTSHCHPQLMKFVCSIYNPLCLQSHQIMPIQPCKEFCEEVHTECISRMSMFGFKWPAHVSCAQFPREEESMCISSKRETVACSPCQPSPSRIQILKRYCQADVAVKAKVISVTAFGNTSSLVVTLDRNMERLLPPPDIRPFKKADHIVEEMRSPGFLDTNDERYTSPNGVSTDNVGDVAPLTTKRTNLRQAEGLQNDSSSDLMMQRTQRANSGKRNRSRRAGGVRGSDRRPRREKRSSRLFETDGLRRMLLQCAGCPALVLPSAGYSRSENRWLIIGNRLPKSAGRPLNGPSMQITMLLSWQNLSAESRQLLHAILSIPREILCYPNARVQMNFGGQTHRLPNYPGAAPPGFRPASSGHPPTHTSVFFPLEKFQTSKQFASQHALAAGAATMRWPGSGSSRNGNHWTDPTVSFPSDSYLQNDAGLVNAKNLSLRARSQRRLERRRLRKEARRLGLPFGKYKPPVSSSPVHPPKMVNANGHPTASKKERRRGGGGGVGGGGRDAGRQGTTGRLGKDGRRLTKEERRKWRQERKRRRQRKKVAQAPDQPSINAAAQGHRQYVG
ncbi:Wnt-activated receptor activity [Sparganum proliferum]